MKVSSQQLHKEFAEKRTFEMSRLGKPCSITCMGKGIKRGGCGVGVAPRLPMLSTATRVGLPAARRRALASNLRALATTAAANQPLRSIVSVTRLPAASFPARSPPSLRAMSSSHGESTLRPEPDKVLQDIADYVHNYKVESELAFETARLCLIDTVGCGLEALRFPDCTAQLGPVVEGTIVPNGMLSGVHYRASC